MKQIISLPLLCTRGAIIFPHQDLVVEVGRKKSIEAVNYSLNENIQIVLVSQKDLKIDNPKPDDLYEIGTICTIKSSRNRDDHLKVTFKGNTRCQILKYYENDGINYCDVVPLNEIYNDLDELEVITKKAITEFNLISSKNARPGFQIGSSFKIDALLASNLADTFAQIYIQNVNEKQKYLEEYNISNRINMMLECILRDRHMADIEASINEKVKQKIEDNQKDYYLREKMRAIKDELGENNSFDDIEDLRQKINDNPYPEHVKKKALEEIRHYEMLPQATGESGVIRSYLEWLLSIPWYEKTNDNEDINLAKQILDEDHYGLKDVKERIIEYLAVKQMTHSLKSPIICLVGPPGVGKTSLAKSVARALDRKFVKVSLGGVKDEAEIRGHRRTYLGSMPGRFIQGMKKAQTTNPVFLIDEIDKMSSDYKGDPSSAMLEVLDPEQNNQFSDNYIEEPYDLSDVLFIATANYKENIPAALLDRLEIIDISSYTEIEKTNIAKYHLIKKQLEANGLKNNQFKLLDDMILYLIRYYTREAGVRQLERLIGKLCRKTVLEILGNSKRSITINKKLINQWIGHEIFEYGVKEKKNQVGVVTGLAYTAFGGDILPVEVNYFDGKGKFVVTGQLGDVMKESTQIALDYVKANSDKYNIDSKFFENHDIHIHCPEGAVPKDGPSAGVTITTALISAITKSPVDKDIAMTGEITLRGNVLPIGGLKEKSLAAHRSGIKNIFIPKNNIKDLQDVPEEVKESIKFIPVDNVEQIIKEAFK